MIGPRVCGSAAPQWIGIGFALPAPGCEVSLMCLDLCLSAIAQVVLCGKASTVARSLMLVKEGRREGPAREDDLPGAGMLSVMVAAQSLFPIEPAAEEQRLVVSGVPWETYVMLREALDHTNLRMTYLEGTLEIMSPSRRHEVEKKYFARFLELFCATRDIPLFPYGSTTWRSEARARGLEADECYSIGERELPEVAIEVIVSRGL